MFIPIPDGIMPVLEYNMLKSVFSLSKQADYNVAGIDNTSTNSITFY